jgi:CRP-like cAMP-binding protein
VFLKRPSDRVQALQAIPLLRDLGRTDLEAIANMTHEVTRQPGEFLLRQGDVGTEMLVLLDGTARVEVDGRQVEEVKPNRILGEMALLDGHRRSASVIATAPCTALAVPYDRFRDFLDRAPQVQRQILVTLSRRVRELLAERAPESETIEI